MAGRATKIIPNIFKPLILTLKCFPYTLTLTKITVEGKETVDRLGKSMKERIVYIIKF